jgi:hypothetical protein
MRLRAFGNAVTGVLVLDGVVAGTWKRTLTKHECWCGLNHSDDSLARRARLSTRL